MIVFKINACTGAITAQGPPCRCTSADGSASLNSKPVKNQMCIENVDIKTISLFVHQRHQRVTEKIHKYVTAYTNENSLLRMKHLTRFEWKLNKCLQTL